MPFSSSRFVRVVAASSRVDPVRARYTVNVAWTLLPVIVIFPFFNDYTGFLAGVILFLAALIAVAMIFVYGTHWRLAHLVLPWVGAITAASCVLYFAWLGYGAGSSALWTFVVPLLAMFMLGLGPGLLVSLVTLVVGASIMTAGAAIGSHDYSEEFVRRFCLSFGLVTALAFGYEYWRVTLELEKADVDAALARAREEARALADLARVCAWCKSVQRPDGQWFSLEEYIADAEARDVSHAICPSCSREVTDADLHP